MKFLALSALVVLASPSVWATPVLTAECEKKVIQSTLDKKERQLDLEYQIEAVREDLNETVVTIYGSFADADADYQYGETYEVRLAKGTCDIQSVEVTEIFED